MDGWTRMPAGRRATAAAMTAAALAGTPAAPVLQDKTLVAYDAAAGKLVLDTTRSSAESGPGSVEAGPVKLPAGEPLRLRVFVDRSVVEVFANDGRQAVMRRLYPSRPDSTGVRVFAEGGPVRVTQLRAWEFMPSNPF